MSSSSTWYGREDIDSFGKDSKALHDEMRTDLRFQRRILREIQLGQVLSMSFMHKLPSSGESLSYCQSMRSRRRERTRLRLPAISTLEHWASEPRSSLLLVQGRTGRASKDFMVDTTVLIRETKLPILWAMRFADYWKTDIAWVDILRVLVLQALQINPGALTDSAHPLTVMELRDASDESDWLLILQRALQGVERIFIVLDADLLGYAIAGDKHMATKCLEMMKRKLASTYIKIFVTKSIVQEAYIREHWDPGSWSNIQVSQDQYGRAVKHRRQNKMRPRRGKAL